MLHFNVSEVLLSQCCTVEFLISSNSLFCVVRLTSRLIKEPVYCSQCIACLTIMYYVSYYSTACVCRARDQFFTSLSVLIPNNCLTFSQIYTGTTVVARTIMYGSILSLCGLSRQKNLRSLLL